MVKPSLRIGSLLLLLILGITLSTAPVPSAEAQVTYTVNQEWVQVWVNKDGSVDIRYNITFTYLSGTPSGIYRVGMPKRGFRIEYARDLSGSSLTVDDVSSGTYYGVDVHLKTPIVLNKLYTFTVYAVVPDMVQEDKMNPGNVGMLFPPTLPEYATGSIQSLRVAITLPEGVTSTEVRYPTGTPFDSVYMDGNNLVVYWQRENWPPTQTFNAGVSFPGKYVSLGPNILLYATAGFLIISLVAVGVVVARRGRAAYERPRMFVEALGAYRGLTAVEAGVVLDLKPTRVLTMILYGLLLKRRVMATATEPLIKLQRLERDGEEPSPPLRYYEIDYLDAVQPDGSLDEMLLARTYLGLRDNVDQKLRSYSREDTVNYYRSVVGRAWEQVTQAGTPELKGDAVEQNIEWLLADTDFDERFKTAFPPDIIIIPQPGWGWYWRGPHMPPEQQRIPAPAPGEAKPIPGQDFANSIVLGLEKSANNMVKDVQDFTNRLVPKQGEAERARSVRGRSSCVCACANCACACACVGCACACAGGGAR